jgi:hypothetical protein
MIATGAAGWALLLAMGCASTDIAGYLNLKSDSNERLMEGSLDVVAQATCDRLRTLQMGAEMTKQGETVYINSTTPLNKVRFTLVLTREKVGDAEKTRVRMQWADKRDGNMAAEILMRL